MYEKFYGLRAKPFQLAPDPRFFFASRGHQRAMAYLRYGLQQGQGFIVVTGDVGTGKSMLVGNLFRDLKDKNIVAAKVVSTNVHEHDLLRLVAAQFEMRYERVGKAVLLKGLEDFFVSCANDGRRVLLVIDEAQNLPRNSLEELRMLSNFEQDGRPLLQSFLLGQREFRGIMRSAGLEQVRQRVIAAYHLRPLGETEVRAYVEHRLKIAGWRGDPKFDEEVYAGIHAFTRGVPRRINTLCDRLLLNGCLDEVHHISRRQLDTVVGEFQSEYGDVDEDPPLSAQAEMSGDPSDTGDGTDPGSAMPVAPRAPRTSGPQIAELDKRLDAMQSAVESLARSVQVATMQQHAVRRDPPPPPEEPRVLVWAIAAGVAAVALLAIAGVGAWFVLAPG